MISTKNPKRTLLSFLLMVPILTTGCGELADNLNLNKRTQKNGGEGGALDLTTSVVEFSGNPAFGPVDLMASKTEVYELTNISNTTLRRFRLRTNHAAFAITSSDCPRQLNSGSKCSAEVTFTPTDADATSDYQAFLRAVWGKGADRDVARIKLTGSVAVDTGTGTEVPQEPAPAPTPTEPAPGSLTKLLSPDSGQLYHGVFAVKPFLEASDKDPFTEALLDSYETTIKSKAAFASFDTHWDQDSSFPLEICNFLKKRNTIPHIRLGIPTMLAARKNPYPNILADIIAGKFDQELHQWGKEAAAFGYPLIVEFGTEVNGYWTNYNGTYNGAGTKDGYGDPNEYDGPERFRDAYRHIISIMRDMEGATNISFMFHVNAGDHPKEDWNKLERYYPGDQWIDLLGASLYGAQTPDDTYHEPFADLMSYIYPRLTALSDSKPIVVAEFGVTAGNPIADQADWTRKALTDMINRRWPRVTAFTWWNESWQNDSNPANDTTMRVEDSPELAATFIELISQDARVLKDPQIMITSP